MGENLRGCSTLPFNRSRPKSAPFCVNADCTQTQLIASLRQVKVPARAVGHLFGPGMTVGIPFAADRLQENCLKRHSAATSSRSQAPIFGGPPCSECGVYNELAQLISRRASPAPARLVSFISAYLRDSTTPGAPALMAARTAALTSDGWVRFSCSPVGISISIPG